MIKSGHSHIQTHENTKKQTEILFKQDFRYFLFQKHVKMPKTGNRKKCFFNIFLFLK